MKNKFSMLWFEIILGACIFGFGSEAIGWVLLTIGLLVPALKIGFMWAEEMRRDTSKYGYGFIDEEGYYN